MPAPSRRKCSACGWLLESPDESTCPNCGAMLTGIAEGSPTPVANTAKRPKSRPQRDDDDSAREPAKAFPMATVLMVGGGVVVVAFCVIAIAGAALVFVAADKNRAIAPQGGDNAKAPAKPFEKDPRFEFLDIFPQANTRRTQGITYPDNHLEELPLGKQIYADVPLWIQDRYMLFDQNTRKFSGISVGNKFAKLHVCHGAHFYGGKNQVLANFVLRYMDGTAEALPVRYGRDVVNYWTADRPPTHAKIAWRGSNRAAAAQGCKLALFLSTYDNPQPQKIVHSIEYVRVNEGQVNTFCVAMTTER